MKMIIKLSFQIQNIVSRSLENGIILGKTMDLEPTAINLLQIRKLIQNIYNELSETKKVVIFKWVKAHNKSSFNERCDVLAKDDK